MNTWEKTKKRLQELQKKFPESVTVELTYKDGSSEVLTLEEVLKKDNKTWERFKLQCKGSESDLKKLLNWVAPDTVIE